MRKKNDTSKEEITVISAPTMTKNLSTSVLRTSLAKMEKDNIGLSQTVDKLIAELSNKDKEIKHLKEMLLTSGSNKTVRIEVTDEEHIAELQLDRLKKKAELGELTLEEVKKYDLLVKNKRLAKGDPTTVNADFRAIPQNPEDKRKLLQMASSVMERDVTENDGE